MQKKKGNGRVSKPIHHQTWRKPQAWFAAPLKVDWVEIQAFKRVVREIKIGEGSSSSSIEATRESIMIYIFMFSFMDCVVDLVNMIA